MTNIALIVEWMLVLLLAPWFGFLALVVAAALYRRLVANRAIAAATAKARLLIVIPAHDEAGVVGVTVRSCLAVDYDPERFQVVVIADNCGDATAEVAEAAGALVVTRTDPTRKSKGFALEDFFHAAPSHPGIRPFDAFVLVDADTSVAGDLLRAFDASLQRGDDFVQGYYSVRNPEASWRTRLITHAFSLVNGVWLAGTDQIGLGVGLKGNGMCFRSAALDRFPWRAHGLVEDMEFAWNLRVGGERVRFQPLARVYGEMVSRSGPAAAAQRRRWESGRQALRMAVRRGLWASPHLSWPRKIGSWLELEFPPLSRLLVVLGLATAIAGAGWVVSGRSLPGSVPLALLVADWVVLVVYVISPVVTIGLPPRTLLFLIYLPGYMAWKLSVGLLKAPREWVRTPREVSAADPAVANRPERSSPN